jgi:hypothetical protein
MQRADLSDDPTCNSMQQHAHIETTEQHFSFYCSAAQPGMALGGHRVQQGTG